jgi:hypothetical protein
MPLRPAPLTLLFAIALTGSAAVLFATSTFGIGISAESETYISAARNFAEGRGLSVASSNGSLAPLTQHAPLYAALLGWCGRFGADIVATARWWSAISVGVLAMLAGLTAGVLSKRTWMTPLTAAMTLCSVAILNLHLTALSESLFLIAILLTLVSLVRYLQADDRRFLLMAALACAAALLTRYAGIAAVATGFLVVWLYGRSKRRRMAAIVFAAMSCAPAVIWGSYAALRAGNPVHRQFAFHPLSLRDVEAAALTVSTWILPGVIAAPIRLAVLAAVLVWFGWVLRRTSISMPCRVFLWFIGTYLVTIGVARSFFDAAIPMDDRILSPLYIPALLAAALAVERAASVTVRRMPLLVPAATAALIAGGFNVARELPCLATVHRSGREYTGAAWRESNLSGWLQSVDPATPLYSNLDSAVRFLHRGEIRGLPPKADIRSGLPNPQYRGDLERFRATVENAHGVIVYFTNSPVPDAFLPTVGELTGQLHLTVVARGDTWVLLRG